MDSRCFMWLFRNPLLKFRRICPIAEAAAVNSVLGIILSLGPPMSKPPCDTGRMNMKRIIGYGTRATSFPLEPGHQVIARFGAAQLVRQPNGRHELIGGTADDFTEAYEWCSLFAPEVVFSAPPTRLGAIVLMA